MVVILRAVQVLLYFLIILVLAPLQVKAEADIPVVSAKLVDANFDPYLSDKRVKTLYKFLNSYDSPLKEYAYSFVREADKNSLDWRFVAAISGVESTFGKQLPYNSYNAWGWGIFGDNMIYFSSYPDAIETISKALRVNYIDKWGAQNVYQIGRFYAASPTWAQRVVLFMRKIDDSVEANSIDNLPITI